MIDIKELLSVPAPQGKYPQSSLFQKARYYDIGRYWWCWSAEAKKLLEPRQAEWFNMVYDGIMIDSNVDHTDELFVKLFPAVCVTELVDSKVLWVDTLLLSNDDMRFATASVGDRRAGLALALVGSEESRSPGGIRKWDALTAYILHKGDIPAASLVEAS